MPDASTNRATNRATDRATNRGGNAPAAGWAPTGYSALFETVSPSSIALSGSDVTSWTDSTANFTATPASGNSPSYPHGTAVNGYDGVKFDSSVPESLEVSLGVTSADLYACFFVVRLDTSTTHTAMEFQDTSNLPQILFRINSAGRPVHLRDGAASGHFFSAGGVSAGGVGRFMWAWDGTNSILRVEGQAEESSAINVGSHDANGSRFGLRWSGAHGLNGGLYCSAIYGGASGVPASSSERAAVWAALGTRFSL